MDAGSQRSCRVLLPLPIIWVLVVTLNPSERPEQQWQLGNPYPTLGLESPKDREEEGPH